MKNKNLFLLLIITLFSVIKTQADEGMWLPLLLNKHNIADMNSKGFKLTAEDIYSVNHASMKDAVMIFGGGCTGELISEEGLLITNHHCGYYFITEHSTVENDYLTNGFWAMSKEEELSNPGLKVTFLVYMEDVTSQVLKNVKSTMTESERDVEIEKAKKIVADEAVKKSDNKYTAKIKSFYYGNQYYLFVEQVFTDVRLVGTPPSAIGKFGGDTDNWMWPRQTGDFSLFRIYADKNNEPADYSPDNVPYKPKKYFPISIKGVKENDFTMVFGYPGTTEEYLPSYAVKLKTETENPSKIKIRDAKLNIINLAMSMDAATRIQYASKQSSIANGWKKWIGENRGLKKLDAVNKKIEFEKKFQTWANSTPELKAKYGNVLEEYKNLYSQLTEYEKTYTYFTEACFNLEAMKNIRNITEKIAEISNTSTNEQIDDIINKRIAAANSFFVDINKTIEQTIFTSMLQLFADNVDKKFMPTIFTEIETNYKNSYKDYSKFLFENSIFVNQDKLLNFYNSYSAKNISKIESGNSLNLFDNFISGILDTDYKTFKNEYILTSNQILLDDPFYIFYQSCLNVYINDIYPTLTSLQAPLDSLNRIYMAGQLEMQPDRIFYPDANSTLRISYGKVASYEPYDGIKYNYFSTLDGMIEKDNPEIYDYDVPDRLKELYLKKDYGQYADADGKIHISFIGTNHTTGGNSGSPVIDADGNLIGVNFDRAWESTMSDVMYDPSQCRNIALDIRYALFVIDKFAGATNLIKEMNIVK